MMQMDTFGRYWSTHKEYRGNVITIFMEKNIHPDRALAQATWEFVRQMDKIDEDLARFSDVS